MQIRNGEENGAPEEIRTPDPQIRSLVLYPAELRVRWQTVLNCLRGDPLKGGADECKRFCPAECHFAATINITICFLSYILHALAR